MTTLASVLRILFGCTAFRTARNFMGMRLYQ